MTEITLIFKKTCHKLMENIAKYRSPFPLASWWQKVVKFVAKRCVFQVQTNHAVIFRGEKKLNFSVTKFSWYNAISTNLMSFSVFIHESSECNGVAWRELGTYITRTNFKK